MMREFLAEHYVFENQSSDFFDLLKKFDKSRRWTEVGTKD